MLSHVGGTVIPCLAMVDLQVRRTLDTWGRERCKQDLMVDCARRRGCENGIKAQRWERVRYW